MGTVAFLKQAAAPSQHIELEKIGINGNGHFLMMESNNREVLQPILDFLQKTRHRQGRRAAAAAGAGVPARAGDSRR